MNNVLAFLFAGAKDFLIVLGIVVATLVLLSIIFFRVRYDRRYFIDLSNRKRIFTHDEMNKSLKNSIRVKNSFHLFVIELSNYIDVGKTTDFATAIEGVQRVVNRIESEVGKGVRISAYDEGKILVYFRDDVNVAIITRSLKEIVTRKISVGGKRVFSFSCVINLSTYPQDGTDLQQLLDSAHSVASQGKAIIVAKPQAEEPKPVPKPVAKKAPVFKTISNAPLISETRSKDEDEIEAIRQALANNEFFLAYHPIVDAKTLNVLGAECLIRWKHPTRGMLPPSAFLPVLERTGEINAVGNWILEEAAKQTLYWRTQGKNFWLSINLSARQLMNADIVPHYREILRKNNLEARDFYMEIYDISLYNKEEMFKQNVDKLAAAGFNLAVDKFGRGTASLSDLEKVPLSMIKVDMSFLTHAKENVLYSGIVGALNAYVKQNNIMMVADGVETIDNVEWCNMYGLHYMQGFFFSKPVEAQEFITNFDSRPWWNKAKVLPVYQKLEKKEEKEMGDD